MLGGADLIFVVFVALVIHIEDFAIFIGAEGAVPDTKPYIIDPSVTEDFKHIFFCAVFILVCYAALDFAQVSGDVHAMDEVLRKARHLFDINGSLYGGSRLKFDIADAVPFPLICVGCLCLQRSADADGDGIPFRYFQGCRGRGYIDIPFLSVDVYGYFLVGGVVMRLEDQVVLGQGVPYRF